MGTSEENNMRIERRFVTFDSIEVREDDQGGLRFSGHAAVFNTPTDIGPFREQVAPGAFKRTIHPDRADVRFLFNHQPDSVMARTVNGTLRLQEDDTGLHTEATLDPSDWDVRRLVPKLKSGNVSQMSFGFRVVDDEWSDPDDDGKQLRTLKEVQLFDVSAVTFPAYDDTDAALNSIAEGALEVAEARGIDSDLDTADVAALYRTSLTTTTDDLPAEPQEQDPPEERETTPEDDPPPAEAPRPSSSRSMRERRLAYLETLT